MAVSRWILGTVSLYGWKFRLPACTERNGMKTTIHMDRMFLTDDSNESNDTLR